MPGPARLCNITDIITCLRKYSGSFGRQQDALCPDACIVRTHSVELSSSIISGQSFKSLLSTHHGDIQKRFYDAMEIRLRVSHEQVTEILTKFQKTIELGERFVASLTVNFIESGASMVNRVKNAASKMDDLILSLIYRDLFGTVSEHKKTYLDYLKPSVEAAKTALYELQTVSTIFIDMLMSYNFLDATKRSPDVEYELLKTNGLRLLDAFRYWSSINRFYVVTIRTKGYELPDQKVWNATLQKLCQLYRTVVLTKVERLVRDALDNITDMHVNNSDVGYNYSVPAEEGCQLGIPVINFVGQSASSQEYDGTVGRMPDTKQCHASWLSYDDMKTLYAEVRDLQIKTDLLVECHSNYGAFLGEINEWLDKSASQTLQWSEQSYNYGEMVDNIRLNLQWLRKLKTEFLRNEMSLRTVAEDIVGDNSTRFVLHFEEAYRNVEQLVITPIHNALIDEESVVYNKFTTALSYYTKFAAYFTDPTAAFQYRRIFMHL